MVYLSVMNDVPSQPPPDLGAAADPARLLARIAHERDKAALAALFHLVGPKLKSMMLKLGAEPALADDLVQETLLAIWRKAHLYAPERGAPITWIYRVARNLRIDHLRRQSNRAYEDIETVEIESEAPGGLQTLEREEIGDRVRKALADLPGDQREVVQLSFVADMTHTDISARLGIPLGTVKSRLRLAYGRLRPLLEDLQ